MIYNKYVEIGHNYKHFTILVGFYALTREYLATQILVCGFFANTLVKFF